MHKFSGLTLSLHNPSIHPLTISYSPLTNHHSPDVIARMSRMDDDAISWVLFDEIVPSKAFLVEFTRMFIRFHLDNLV